MSQTVSNHSNGHTLIDPSDISKSYKTDAGEVPVLKNINLKLLPRNSFLKKAQNLAPAVSRKMKNAKGVLGAAKKQLFEKGPKPRPCCFSQNEER